MDNISVLIKEIVKLNEPHLNFINNALKYLSIEERKLFASYINFFISEGKDVDYIADCYNTLVKDIVKEQLYFLRYKKYRHSKYSEVESAIYFNKEYMEKYMIGLGVSIFLWPQHLKIHRFFMDKLPHKLQGNYLEIGPGHGFYFMSAMKNSAFTLFEGIDISPTSVMLTNKIIKSNFFGKFSNYNIHQSDFSTYNSYKKYNAIVMGEVLEHVERPDKILKKINSIADKDSFIFITTVINAPAIDHIYLFDSIESIKEIIFEAKFSITELLLSPLYDKLSIEDNLNKKLPIDVALIIKKNGTIGEENA